MRSPFPHAEAGAGQLERRRGIPVTAVWAIVPVVLLLASAAPVGQGLAQAGSGRVAPLMVTREQVNASRNSVVHLVFRNKGSDGRWFPLCSGSKISPTELMSAEHCFGEATSRARQTGKANATNFINTVGYEFAISDPENARQPILPVTGLSLGRLNDLALVTVDPAARTVSRLERRKWRRIATLHYPLADKPPPLNTPAVITSYPIKLDGRLRRITWFGWFAGRKYGGISNPARGAYEDIILTRRSNSLGCRPGASGSRLVFANGTTSGALTKFLTVNDSVDPWQRVWDNQSLSPAVHNTDRYHAICMFSVLTDRVLRYLRAGLRHLATPRPSPLPPPTLTPAPPTTTPKPKPLGAAVQPCCADDGSRTRAKHLPRSER